MPGLADLLPGLVGATDSVVKGIEEKKLREAQRQLLMQELQSELQKEAFKQQGRASLAQEKNQFTLGQIAARAEDASALATQNNDSRDERARKANQNKRQVERQKAAFRAAEARRKARRGQRSDQRDRQFRRQENQKNRQAKATAAGLSGANKAKAIDGKGFESMLDRKVSNALRELTPDEQAQIRENTAGGGLQGWKAEQRLAAANEMLNNPTLVIDPAVRRAWSEAGIGGPPHARGVNFGASATVDDTISPAEPRDELEALLQEIKAGGPPG